MENEYIKLEVKESENFNLINTDIKASKENIKYMIVSLLLDIFEDDKKLLVEILTKFMEVSENDKK